MQEWRMTTKVEAARKVEAASEGGSCQRRWRLQAKLELQTKVEAAKCEAANKGGGC
jgi:hypothetical protein